MRRRDHAAPHAEPAGPETVIDGTRYLYFGGTGYLGLANHPDVLGEHGRGLLDQLDLWHHANLRAIGIDISTGDTANLNRHL